MYIELQTSEVFPIPEGELQISEFLSIAAYWCFKETKIIWKIVMKHTNSPTFKCGKLGHLFWLHVVTIFPVSTPFYFTTGKAILYTLSLGICNWSMASIRKSKHTA